MGTIKVTRKRVLLLAALLILALSAVGIYAQWSTTVDQPPAAGKFGTISVTSAVPTGSPTNMCYPNGPCDGLVKLTAPTPSTLKIVGWSASSAASVTAITGAQGSCLPADITGNVFIGAKTLTGAQQIAIPAGSTEVTLPGLFTAGDVPTGCQNARFVWNATPPSFVLNVSQ